jgi:hypothetical protein
MAELADAQDLGLVGKTRGGLEDGSMPLPIDARSTRKSFRTFLRYLPTWKASSLHRIWIPQKPGAHLTVLSMHTVQNGTGLARPQVKP